MWNCNKYISLIKVKTKLINILFFFVFHFWEKNYKYTFYLKSSSHLDYYRCYYRHNFKCPLFFIDMGLLCYLVLVITALVHYCWTSVYCFIIWVSDCQYLYPLCHQRTSMLYFWSLLNLISVLVIMVGTYCFC